MLCFHFPNARADLRSRLSGADVSILTGQTRVLNAHELVLRAHSGCKEVCGERWGGSWCCSQRSAIHLDFFTVFGANRQQLDASWWGEGRRLTGCWLEVSRHRAVRLYVSFLVISWETKLSLALEPCLPDWSYCHSSERVGWKKLNCFIIQKTTKNKERRNYKLKGSNVLLKSNKWM